MTRVHARSPDGGAGSSPSPAPPAWHARVPEEAARALDVDLSGLTRSQAAARRERYGPNRLEPPAPPSRLAIFTRQFRSPLIYVLVGAAGLALALAEFADAGFIAAVLVLNAVIGYVNEIRAEREVRAIAGLVRTRTRVYRDGHAIELDGEDMVPGDLVILEPGARVGADVRLTDTRGLRIDESLLTGESVPVDKEAALTLPKETPLADRRNMAFAGSLVIAGRGFGLVVATGATTEVGAIASHLARVDVQPPPLLLQMRRFAHVIGWSAIAMSSIIVLVGLALGQHWEELVLSAVALAVSAIPEGLPIAMTVALAVAVSRMAERRVVVRHLPAVEALGSCSVIATDKTGTLTRNELTAELVVINERGYRATGAGYAPEGELRKDGGAVTVTDDPGLFRLLRAACLANEASLSERSDRPGEWDASGDPTDVALLALGMKAGCDPIPLLQAYEPLTAIPFEPERRYAASFHRRDGGGLVCVKGAPERVLSMCREGSADAGDGDRNLPLAAAERTVNELMEDGYRVLALAEAETSEPVEEGASPPEPEGLSFLGFVAMTDPPREGVQEAIARCKRAGIRVVMVTGDHAITAIAIGARIGLAEPDATALEGKDIEKMTDEELVTKIHDYVIFARATPDDKLRIIRAWQAHGAYVAVTGDGVNDAPALQQANLGVAMGRAGTDVAREAAELVITDDNFASIVAGVEEGRVAYDNIRKVTYLLISTGAGEVLIVTTALIMGLGVPFTAVQLLWLNLVTNGIQDVALAFEPGEADVLERQPRPPRERILNRLMIERTLLAGLTFGGLGLACWVTWTQGGLAVPDARNLLVNLFVLFEIFHIGNARSETISLFRLSPFGNPVLLVGTLGALGIHLVALYTPFLRELLEIQPIAFGDWVGLAAVALLIVVVMEIHKWSWRVRFGARRRV